MCPLEAISFQCIWKDYIYLFINSNKNFINIRFLSSENWKTTNKKYSHSWYNCLFIQFCSFLLSFLQVRLNLGMYIVFILDWLTVFHRDQILVLRLEDYAANLKMAIKAVFDFLSVGTCRRVMFSLFITQMRSKFLSPWNSSSLQVLCPSRRRRRWPSGRCWTRGELPTGTWGPCFQPPDTCSGNSTSRSTVNWPACWTTRPFSGLPNPDWSQSSHSW